MQQFELDTHYLTRTLLELLDTPSPTGFTDEIVHYTGHKLSELDIPFELTRRGAIRANLSGRESAPDRAIVAHLDTIGAMVTGLKDNGRLTAKSVGTWSSRFAEGARVTVFTDSGPYRGTFLPLKASGHVYDAAIDTQPVAWSNLELRVDEICHDLADLKRLGFNVGDFIAVDPGAEISETGFINSRFLDDKAGVATLLTVAKAVVEKKAELPVDAHLLFTISEEVGSGASGILHRDVAEMVTIDTGPVAPLTNGCEFGVNICMHDMAGPFDYHLTHKLIKLCQDNDIEHRRNIYPYYRSDSASAIESGNDIRTALVCFGADATHGYERSHMSSLTALGQLLCHYIHSEPTFRHDQEKLAPLEGFPSMPTDPAESVDKKER